MPLFSPVVDDMEEDDIHKDLIAEAEITWSQRERTIQHVLFTETFIIPSKALTSKGTFVHVSFFFLLSTPSINFHVGKNIIPETGIEKAIQKEYVSYTHNWYLMVYGFSHGVNLILFRFFIFYFYFLSVQVVSKEESEALFNKCLKLVHMLETQGFFVYKIWSSTLFFL